MIFKKIIRQNEKAETYLSVVFDWREFDPSIGVVLFFNPNGGVLLGVRLTFWRWFFHCCICRSLKLDYMLNTEKTGLADHMKAHLKYIKKEILVQLAFWAVVCFATVIQRGKHILNLI